MDKCEIRSTLQRIRNATSIPGELTDTEFKCTKQRIKKVLWGLEAQADDTSIQEEIKDAIYELLYKDGGFFDDIPADLRLDFIKSKLDLESISAESWVDLCKGVSSIGFNPNEKKAIRTLFHTALDKISRCDEVEQTKLLVILYFSIVLDDYPITADFMDELISEVSNLELKKKLTTIF